MVDDSVIEILKQLKKILLEEKEALIKNEGKVIQELVTKKEVLIEMFEKVEINNDDKDEIRHLVTEIQSLQETNAILTQQAMNYASTFINAFQKEAQKSSTYSKEGNLNVSKNTSLLDQSL